MEERLADVERQLREAVSGIKELSLQMNKLSSCMDKPSSPMKEHSSQKEKLSSQMEELSSRMEKHSSQMEELSSRMEQHSSEMKEHSARIEKHTTCMKDQSLPGVTSTEEQSLLTEYLCSKTQIEVGSCMHALPSVPFTYQCKQIGHRVDQFNSLSSHWTNSRLQS